MKLTIKTLTCRCGHRHEVGALSPYDYGQFLMRSASDGSRRYLDATADPVYEDLSRRIDEHPRHRHDSEHVRADVLQRVFGITCDGSLGSTDLQIRRPPNCPACGSGEVVDWVINEPPRFEECEIPPVTHVAWERLSEAEKRAIVDAALADEST